MDFGKYFKPPETSADNGIMKKITNRKNLLTEKDEAALLKHMFGTYRVDLVSDTPEEIFKNIGNFAALVTRFTGRQPMARMVYEFLYRYMVVHNVIITRDGISEVQRIVKERCKSLLNKKKFLTKAEGFLVSYKKATA